MKLSEQLIGKNITFIAHHDAFPSMYKKGEVIKVACAKYTRKEVVYTLKNEEGEVTTFEASEHIVKALLTDGEYIADSFASRETKKIYVK